MRILITDGLAKDAVKMLETAGHVVVMDEVTPEKLLEVAGEYDCIIVRSRSKVTRAVIEKGNKLKVLARAGIGVDNIDMKAASEKGIKVVNAPLGSTISVAELAFGHMIDLSRGITRGTAALKQNKWLKKELKGYELEGKTVGIIGCGRIGQALATRCKAFGMKVKGFDPYLPVEAAKSAGIELLGLDDLLKISDYISLHVALTDSTRKMLGGPQFTMMKKNAYLINCARGGVVDEDALYNALKEGRLAGAGLDVFETEPPVNPKLAELDNVTFTPHIGANTKEAQDKAGVQVAEQVLLCFSGKEPEFWVNKPR
jgi:D-3-phosphoglycerate dehydrogenase